MATNSGMEPESPPPTYEMVREGLQVGPAETLSVTPIISLDPTPEHPPAGPTNPSTGGSLHQHVGAVGSPNMPAGSYAHQTQLNTVQYFNQSPITSQPRPTSGAMPDVEAPAIVSPNPSLESQVAQHAQYAIQQINQNPALALHVQQAQQYALKNPIICQPQFMSVQPAEAMQQINQNPALALHVQQAQQYALQHFNQNPISSLPDPTRLNDPVYMACPCCR